MDCPSGRAGDKPGQLVAEMAEGGESVHVEKVSDTLGALLRLLGVLIPFELEHDGLSYVDHTRLLEAMLRNANAREEARGRERGRERERERGREGGEHAEGATAQQSRAERDGNDGQKGERRQRSAQQRAGEGDTRASQKNIMMLSTCTHQPMQTGATPQPFAANATRVAPALSQPRLKPPSAASGACSPLRPGDERLLCITPTALRVHRQIGTNLLAVTVAKLGPRAAAAHRLVHADQLLGDLLSADPVRLARQGGASTRAPEAVGHAGPRARAERRNAP